MKRIAIDHARSVSPAITALALATLGHACAVGGRESEAVELLERLTRVSRLGYVPPYYMATVCVGLGRADEAIEFLNKGVECRDGWLTWLGVEPSFDPLRQDSRFQSILRRIGLHELNTTQ